MKRTEVMKKNEKDDKKKALKKKDRFIPRQSQHVSGSKIQADGDIWQEGFTVCEYPAAGGGKKNQNTLRIRSYYTNLRSGQRTWDEPPSGASQVVQATDEVHKMAKIQLQEMKLLLSDENNGKKKKDKKKRPKRAFFRKRKDQGEEQQRKEGDDNENDGVDMSLQQALWLGRSGSSDSIELVPSDAALTPNPSSSFESELQQAMEASLALSLQGEEDNDEDNDQDGGGKLPSAPPEPQSKQRKTKSPRMSPRPMNDEEALAMAISLSLAEQNAKSSSKPAAAAAH